jgi:hypothetical protein
VDDATQNITAKNVLSNFTWLERYWCLLITPLVGAGVIVEINVFFHDSPEVGATQDKQMIQTFFLHGAHPSFSNRIGIW